MKKRKYRLIFWFGAALLLAPGTSLAQGAGTAPAATPQAAAPSAPVFKQEELDQILAPIALYPDDLLAQILMASSYPLEIVQADRWAKDPKNKDLKGDALANALQNQTWDPSVKSLVPFPSVLDMMSQQLDWTQKLGDAVLAQQKDVMDSVQRLRQKAQAADQLKTNEQQVVTTQPPTESSGGSQTIIIQPANPQVVYVPTYNPTVVYGGWPYPTYPPYYYPPSPLYYPGQAFFSGLAFGAGVAVTAGLWGCCNSNWGGGNVNVNVNNWNNINRNNIRNGRATQYGANGNNWRHDPGHRGGVAYRDAGTRQQYLGNRGNASANSRDFRGYGNQGGNGLGANRGNQGLGNNRGNQGLGNNNRGGAGGNNLGNNRGGTNLGGNNRGGSNLGGGNRATQLPSQNRGGNLQGNRGGSTAGNRGRQNNAFGDFGSRGSSVNRQSNRGFQSRSGSRGGGGRQFNRGGGGRR